nr:MAG TPA: hypothetical protein [Caudoviricetes sp.]
MTLNGNQAATCNLQVYKLRSSEVLNRKIFLCITHDTQIRLCKVFRRFLYANCRYHFNQEGNMVRT